MAVSGNWLVDNLKPAGPHLLDLAGSWLCGVVAFFGLLSYLDAYYRELWGKHFALPGDRIFFRFFALLCILMLALGFKVWPLYWYWQMSVLYILLLLKKVRTRDHFVRAYKYAYGIHGGSKHDRARYALAIAFTRLWLRNGVIASLIYGTLLTALHWQHCTISTIAGRFHLTWYLLFSACGVAVSWIVWINKATVGLRRMNDRVAAGDSAFFDKMWF